MAKYFKRIYTFNVITIIITFLYSLYLLRVIFIDYIDIENRIMASIIIPVAVIIITSLFISSINTMSRDLYDRFVQKAATIFLITYVATSDILIIYAFPTFHIIGKAIFILINVVALLHAKRYVFKNRHRNIDELE